MKKCFLSMFFTTLCVLILLCQSCSEEEFEVVNTSQLNIPEEYCKIGVMHNLGLEYAFDDIRALYANKTRSGDVVKLTKTNYETISKKIMIGFCEKNEYFGTTDKICEESMTDFKRNLSTKSGSSVVLSSEAQQLIKEIRTALAKGGGKKDLKRFRNDLDVINKKAEQSLSEVEAIAIYAGTSTCYNSYIYWKENYMKWNIALNYPELLSQYSDEELNKLKVKNGKLSLSTRSWWDDAWNSVGETWDSISGAATEWWDNGGKDVVAADAGSAVEGAIGGAMGGAAAGAVGAGPGAIAGGIAGGCYGSINESIGQWIK